MDKSVKHLGADPVDFGEVLKVIEKSYAINLSDDDLSSIRTFGDFTDHTLATIDLRHQEGCTTQQAFYKLRSAIADLNMSNKRELNPATNLTDIFPRRSRKKDVRKMESQLGVDFRALRPHHAVMSVLYLTLVASIICFFFNAMYAWAGLLISITGIRVAIITGREFNFQTLGEMAEQMTQTSYAKSRREYGTMNKKEIAGKIETLLIRELCLDTDRIDRDTVII